MSRRPVLALLGALAGYTLGVTVGTWATDLIVGSAPEHPLRAAVTGVFVVGPLLAVVGAVAGAVIARREP